MKTFFSLFFSINLLFAGIFPTDITPISKSKIFGKIKILDQKELVYRDINGITFSEISDLAYYIKKQKLFMNSDEGKLFTFRVKFDDKIVLLEPLDGVKLKKKDGKNFKKYRRDSEGMTLDGKNHLLISFEGKAKIAWFHKNSKKKGQQIQKYSIPKELRSSKNFRSKNKSLEALAWHKKYGIITSAEWPLKMYNKKRQTIYAMSGKQWHFKAEPEGRSSVSAMEVMDDGNILVIERSFTGYMNPFIVTLKKIYLNIVKNSMCKTEVLLKMNSHNGWHVDNFEGLTRVGRNRYLMVSDDNNNFFQKTLLIYFEVLN